MTSEFTAIEQTAWRYLDGVFEGDAGKLEAAFHPLCHIHGARDGVIVAEPRDIWIARLKTRPSPQSRGLARHERILLIDQSSPTTALVKVECAVPPRFFIDYLNLIRTEEGWRILAKLFATEIRDGGG